jgi:hypothetical protein
VHGGAQCECVCARAVSLCTCVSAGLCTLVSAIQYDIRPQFCVESTCEQSFAYVHSTAPSLS